MKGGRPNLRVNISQPAGLSFQDHRRCIFAIIGGSIGNLVEWYDFYIYSFGSLYFAPSSFLRRIGPLSFLMRPASSRQAS